MIPPTYFACRPDEYVERKGETLLFDEGERFMPHHASCPNWSKR